MIQTIRKAWGIPELRKKIIFTLLILLIFRIGNTITVPYIDVPALKLQLDTMGSTYFGLLNAISGGAFSMATVFALSIQPYINSSIIIQLLTVAIPALERLAKDGGEEGRKKIQSITRYTTVAIAILQALGYYMMIKRYGLLADGAEGIWPALVIIVTLIAGSSFVMWMGEQVTEFGVGNGISIILFAGILSRVPSMVSTLIDGVKTWSAVNNGTLSLSTLTEAGYTEDYAQQILDSAMAPWAVALLVIGMLALIVFIVFINDAERRIPVQYAKRVVGNKMYGGQNTHIPIKVNMSGVMPIIFASSILMLPTMILSFWKNENHWFYKVLRLFSVQGVFYAVIYFVLIIGFAYFYATIQFNPIEMANNLRKNGGAIPGIRPGKSTSDFISKILSRITLMGAIFLSVIAILPILIGSVGGINISLGGTSVLIMVGVALDTVRNLESQMMMRHYKGFLD